MSLMINLLMYAVLATAWGIFCATTRLVSLTTVAFFGVGCYSVAVLSDFLPWPLVLLVASLLGGLLALFVDLRAFLCVLQSLAEDERRAFMSSPEILGKALVGVAACGGSRPSSSQGIYPDKRSPSTGASSTICPAVSVFTVAPAISIMTLARSAAM